MANLSKASNVVQEKYILYDVTGFTQKWHSIPVATNSRIARDDCTENDTTSNILDRKTVDFEVRAHVHSKSRRHDESSEAGPAADSRSARPRTNEQSEVRAPS